MTGESAAAVPLVVVMGVSAAGKTSVARGLAARLGVDWLDADDLHSPENVAKMAAGTPLTDADRWPWLDAVGAALAQGRALGGRIIACSALRRVYRDRLRTAVPDVRFVHLTGSAELLQARAAGRAGHYMPPALLPSQLALLEPLQQDEDGIAVDVSGSVEQIVDEAAAWIE